MIQASKQDTYVFCVLRSESNLGGLIHSFFLKFFDERLRTRRNGG